MELVIYYCIFALATTLTILLRFYIPVLRRLKSEGVNNSSVNNPILGILVFIVLTFFLVPLLITTLIIQEHGDRFVAGLHRAMAAQDY